MTVRNNRLAVCGDGSNVDLQPSRYEACDDGNQVQKRLQQPLPDG